MRKGRGIKGGWSRLGPRHSEGQAKSHQHPDPLVPPIVGPGAFYLYGLFFRGLLTLQACTGLRTGMAKRTLKGTVVVMTIGHSNRPLETFLQFLQSHAVKQLIDVRTIPRSRHNPQFNKETLPQILRGIGIRYRHMPRLGGLRQAQRDSPNTGWRSPSFQGYADYMQTKEFEASVKTLIELAKKKRLVLMCAEAVPWRCHRSLISDALVARGVPVEHIMTQTLHRPHKLTPFANVKGNRITYPLEQANLFIEPGK